MFSMQSEEEEPTYQSIYADKDNQIIRLSSSDVAAIAGYHPFKKVFELITLAQLEHSFEVGQQVTKDLLVVKGLVKNSRVLIKVLGTGALSKKLHVFADAYSASAAQAIAACGGEARFTKEG